MANVKISNLPAAGALTGTEIVPVVTGGATKRTTVSAIAGLGAPRTGWTVSRVANQSIPNGFVTDIIWDTEVQDTPGNFTAPSTTLTVPVGGDGLWMISFQLNTANIANGYAKTQIVAGGITYVNTDFDDVGNPIPGGWHLNVGAIPLVATNTIVCSFSYGGGTLDVTGRLSAYKIGA